MSVGWFDARTTDMLHIRHRPVQGPFRSQQDSGESRFGVSPRRPLTSSTPFVSKAPDLVEEKPFNRPGNYRIHERHGRYPVLWQVETQSAVVVASDVYVRERPTETLG